MTTITNRRRAYPAYAYTAYSRRFEINELADGTFLVTVSDYPSGNLIDSRTVADRTEAFRQVHQYENEARATGAKR